MEEYRSLLETKRVRCPVEKKGKYRYGNDIISGGKGHGLGFSQYGGNEMAKESANAKEILQYYFPEMDVLNIKSVNC